MEGQVADAVQPAWPPTAHALERADALSKGRVRAAESQGFYDLLTAFGLATTTVFGAAALLLSDTRPTGRDVVLAAVLGLLYLVAYSVEFESPIGDSVPTEPVLVVAFFLLPTHLVPALICVSLAVYELIRPAEGSRSPRNLAIRVISSFHSLGPAIVLVAFARSNVDLADWKIYLLALGAQFAFDFAAAAVRCWGLGQSVRSAAAPLGWTFVGDALLAPIGLAAALATDSPIVAAGLVAGPVLLIRVVAVDRARQVDYQVELGAAVAAARADALVDTMTGLGNRRAWETAVADAAAQMNADSSRQATLVLADLDNLKVTNDSFGHDAGDQLIASFAAILRTNAPSHATVARVGGDEFAALIVHDGSFQPERFTRVVASLTSDTRLTLSDDSTVTLSASLGWATTNTPDALGDAYRSADKAVFAAKARRSHLS